MEWQFRNDSPIYTQLTQRLTQAIVAGEFRQPQHGAARARRP